MASPEPGELEEKARVSFDCAWGCAPVWIQYHMSQRSHALQPIREDTLYVSNLAYEMSQARLKQLIEDKAEVSVVSAAADWGLLLPFYNINWVSCTAMNDQGKFCSCRFKWSSLKKESLSGSITLAWPS